MKRQTKDSEKRKPGRPKGSGKGRITTTLAFKASPEYRTWMAEFSKFLNGEMSDVIRESIRNLARERGFRPPPMK
jgi:hypothetical protein